MTPSYNPDKNTDRKQHQGRNEKERATERERKKNAEPFPSAGAAGEANTPPRNSFRLARDVPPPKDTVASLATVTDCSLSSLSRCLHTLSPFAFTLPLSPPYNALALRPSLCYCAASLRANCHSAIRLVRSRRRRDVRRALIGCR